MANWGRRDGYAGIAFRFSSAEDWSDYRYLELTLMFGDPQVYCNLGIHDESNKVQYVNLFNDRSVGAGITVTMNEKNERITKVSLRNNVKDLNFPVVIEFSCSAGTDTLKGHNLAVSRIRLLKD